MMRLLTTGFLISLLSPSAWSANRGLVEGVAATGNAVYVTTATPRVHVSTTGYGGAVANVGLVTSSNVVISNPTSSDYIILYATGSAKFAGAILVNGSIVPSTATYSFSNLAVSTFTFIKSQPTITAGTPVGIATVTLTMTGGRALLSWHCPMSIDTGSNRIVSGALVNGAYFDGETSAFGFTKTSPPNPNLPVNMSFTHLDQTARTGATIYAVTAYAPDGGVITVNYGGDAACQFAVVEQ